MSKYKRLFIIGHPGAGKAVLAKALAEKIGWQFIDADFGLDFRIGKPLMDILGKPGKNIFLECLSQILISQKKQENIVVATDGNIVSHPKNREMLLSEFTVYLRVSIPIQMQRLARFDPSLLSDADTKSLLEKFHEERDGFYEEVAHLVIDSDDSALEKHVLNILKYLELESKPGNHSPLRLDKKDLILFHKTRHTPISLSEEQAYCLKLLASGKSSKEIARVLHISHRTVEGYIAKAMELLGCSSSKELIALYLDRT